MEIKMVSLTELKPYERNPRKNKKAIDAVAESIKEFGFKVPIVLDKDNVIVGGHTRYAAAKKLGLTEVPCVIADDLTDEQVKAFRLADNKTAELAEWDYEKLADELDDILDIDMTSFGFDDIVDELEQTAKEQKEVEISDVYNVIVSCDDEQELQAVYERLLAEGYKCSIST